MTERSRTTDLLIIGAGPFGLALAAEAGRRGIDYLIAGRHMGFWRAHMPSGMYLRSAADWHLDTAGEATIERFFREANVPTAEADPIPVARYLEYVDWFTAEKAISPLEWHVDRVDLDPVGEPFLAIAREGVIRARTVALAVGFQYFANVPADLVAILPAGSFVHTCDYVDFGDAAGHHYLVVGGRQSAFEWAALLLEAGAASVTLTHRHSSPVFAVSDWSWTNPIVAAMVENPGWYQDLPDSEREAVRLRMWGEGRLKVEPWLEPRLNDGRFAVHPNTRVVEASQDVDGTRVRLDGGIELTVDRVVLATGYKPDLARVPFMAAGNILPRMTLAEGLPVLSTAFETDVPGLFATSILATPSFGPFFGFTLSARTAATVLAHGVATRLAQSG